MLSAINAARVERGIHALVASETAAAAAERHAQDMAAHPGIVHIGTDGTDDSGSDCFKRGTTGNRG
jgi:uncharacterized protein YkwD